MHFKTVYKRFSVSQNRIKCSDFPVTDNTHSVSIKLIRYCSDMKCCMCTVSPSLGLALVWILCHTETSSSNTANPAQNTSWSHQCSRSSNMEILVMVWTDERGINGKKPSWDWSWIRRWVLFMCWRLAWSRGVFMCRHSSFNLRCSGLWKELTGKTIHAIIQSHLQAGDAPSHVFSRFIYPVLSQSVICNTSLIIKRKSCQNV